jgi:hypothetical protein
MKKQQGLILSNYIKMTHYGFLNTIILDMQGVYIIMCHIIFLTHYKSL